MKHATAILSSLLLVILAGVYVNQLDNTDESESRLRQKIIGKAEFELAKVIDPKTKEVPAERLTEAFEIAQERLKQKTPIAGITWDERGPNNVSGRTKSLLIDSRDPSGNTIWTGGVSGGLWTSTNGGQSWTIISDQFNNMSVTAIAQDPNDADIIYFGTGEGHSFTSFLKGNGIYRSTDGGITFAPIPFTVNNPDFEFINNLAIHSYNGTTHLYAATSSSDTSRGGLLFTQNGGTSWFIFKGNNSGTNDFACDVEITAPDPTNNNNSAIVAGFGGFGNELAVRNGGTTESDGTYISFDGGFTWFFDYTSTNNEGRMDIATSPTDPNIRYLFYESISSNLLPTIHGTAFIGGALSYLPISLPPQGWLDFDCNAPAQDITRGQDFYDLAIAVSPANPFRLIIGGVDLWGYERDPVTFANNWVQLTNWFGNCGLPFVHADQHFIRFENNNELYVCNDGGVWKSNNANSSFPTFNFRGNSLNITQFYACDIHPGNNTNQYITGSQDNGSPFFTSAGINSTIDVSSGDGGFCHIDQNNPLIQITSNTFQNYNVTTNGWASGVPALRANTTGGRFINPTDYDDNSKKLYCSNGAGNYTRWEDPSTLGSTLTTVTVNQFPNISDGAAWHVRVSPNVANRVYFGFGNGTVYRVNNAHTGTSRSAQAVFDLNLGAGHMISCIEIEEGNENHMLVTLSNFGVTSIYETFNGNTNNPTWRSVEGNLPDMPVRWALFNPNNTDQAFIATDLGIWSTTNLRVNADWDPTNVGLSNTRIDMIKYRPSDQQMVVATHGRGLFTSDDLGSSGNCPNNQVFSNESLSGTHEASNTIQLTDINLNGNTTLNAPEVILNPTFTVNSGTTLNITSDGCD